MNSLHLKDIETTGRTVTRTILEEFAALGLKAQPPNLEWVEAFIALVAGIAKGLGEDYAKVDAMAARAHAAAAKLFTAKTEQN